VSVDIRPWELDVGWTYEVSLTEDNDLDESPDETPVIQEFTLAHRGDYCPLVLKGRNTYMITFRKLSHDKAAGPTPDLAISPDDIELSPAKHFVTARVHNVGTKAVEEIPVALYEGTPEEGNLIGTALISHLDWPQLLDRQTIKFGWRYKPKAEEATFTVVIDPDNELEEILEENNRVTHTLRFDLEPVPQTVEDSTPVAAPATRGGRGR
jgi:hypothetical protein